MLKPKCLNGSQCYGFSNIKGGYILPCCWCDKPNYHEEFKSLMQEHLKITNVDSVESIIYSKELQDFYDILVNRPEEAPSLCQTFCSGVTGKIVTYTTPKGNEHERRK